MNTRKVTIIALGVYLGVGFVFALYAWTNPLKAFTCEAPNEPHGTIGMGGMWANPDPSRCTRDGLEIQHIAPLPLFTVAWPFVISMNTYHNWRENEMLQTSLLENNIGELQELHNEALQEKVLGSSDSLRETYHSTTLGVRVTYPKDLYLLSGENARAIHFSVLPPDDIRQQSSVGLMSSLTIKGAESVPEGAVPTTITRYDGDEYGIRALVSEEVGMYAGGTHRTYFFEDYGISAHYFVSSVNEAAFEPIIRSIQFDAVRPAAIIDGERTIFGTLRASTIENGYKSFNSEALDMSFQYPAHYLLFERGESTHAGYSLSLVQEESAFETVARTRAGAPLAAGQQSITFAFHHNTDALTLREWVENDVADFPPELVPEYRPTMIDGTPALAYRTESIKTTDNVVFLHGDRVVHLSATEALADDFIRVRTLLRLLSDSTVRANCMQEIPLERVDDASRNTDGTVTMRWWDDKTQANTQLTVPYEPETNFVGCSESIKTFLKQIHENKER